ncbi:hypothetical protein GGI25_005402 [Coemansia spiralis]|uniref:Stress-response A/B barrel domain-containing protein n=2 Tax=Coemansia TaxID=4863 RepID=A0A9W8G478_9FUNG|nr:stress responsive A/B barrel domain-containing protein [Coemansia spiralis]KAJ1991214.1 hypothetical protein EDC05_003576 [Coemansia umbellata]KAJ2621184.1 hypothetical protein GGI26_004353 [Coemansia sp. RSA 1358]KAJ2671711.1 hypothetical protein GGI25_005402 [Coemansia spiralis]
MPFVHIVLLPLKADAPKELVDQVVSEFNQMKDSIPFVITSRCGRTVTQRGKQYTHALVVELEKSDQLSAYANHPVHQAVLQKVQQIVSEETLAMDFDSPQ